MPNELHKTVRSSQRPSELTKYELLTQAARLVYIINRFLVLCTHSRPANELHQYNATADSLSAVFCFTCEEQQLRCRPITARDYHD